MANGFIIAAPSSGSGKTVVTIGLLRALARRGVAIAPAKIGPDYIDPAFHEFASGRPSYNLDGWAMRQELLRELASIMERDASLLLVEGVMGLYDGAVKPGLNGHGATADIARLLNLPVIMVIDCARMGQSVAAVVQGFAKFDSTINVAGVILNKLGSVRHVEMIKSALNQINMPVVGAVPRSDVMQLSSRHLGLVQASELKNIERQIDTIADHIEAHVDLDGLKGLAGGIESGISQDGQEKFLEADYLSEAIFPGNHIAVARDDAFRFFYPHHQYRLEKACEKLSFFSPLNDEAPLPEADTVFLPGGYPELFADQLSRAAHFKEGVRAAASAGKTVYGECGGYMTLGETLIDKSGVSYEMLGLLDLVTSFKTPKLNLGYRYIERSDVNSEMRPRFRAHEFHYATIEREAGTPLYYDLDDERDVHYGLTSGSVSGSFMHLIDRAA